MKKSNTKKLKFKEGIGIQNKDCAGRLQSSVSINIDEEDNFGLGRCLCTCTFVYMELDDAREVVKKIFIPALNKVKIKLTEVEVTGKVN